MSRRMVDSKTGCGTTSNVTLRTKVACSFKFSAIGTHFAPPLHPLPLVVCWQILWEVPFNLPRSHWLSGRPSTLPHLAHRALWLSLGVRGLTHCSGRSAGVFPPPPLGRSSPLCSSEPCGTWVASTRRWKYWTRLWGTGQCPRCAARC